MLICDAFHICDDLRKMNKSISQLLKMLIHGNAPLHAIIHWRTTFGTWANSASNGTRQYYGH